MKKVANMKCDVVQALSPHAKAIPAHIAYLLDGRNTVYDLITSVCKHYMRSYEKKPLRQYRTRIKYYRRVKNTVKVNLNEKLEKYGFSVPV